MQLNLKLIKEEEGSVFYTFDIKDEKNNMCFKFTEKDESFDNINDLIDYLLNNLDKNLEINIINFEDLTDFEKKLTNSFKEIWINEFTSIKKEIDDLEKKK